MDWDLPDAIAAAWGMLEKAPISMDDPVVPYVDQAVVALRELHAALDAGPDSAVSQAMAQVKSYLVWVGLGDRSEEVQQVLRAIHEVVRHAGADILADW